MTGTLLPCRACGAPCSVQMFSHPEKGIEAKLWMCSAHRSLGGVCPNETAYFNADAWNYRPTPTPDTITARLEELLERATPLPWRFEGHQDHSHYLGNIIGSYGLNSLGNEQIRTISCQTRYESHEGEARENAALIVEAINALPALLSERATLKAELEEARGVLEPFALLAATDDTPGANMHDPLSKWLTVAHLQAARAYLAKEPTNG